uniref:hypothetical protein n=1 Tax=Herbidospora sakaeratensis TaxID=564415 RepID=UPI000782CC41|nr:hypothetical protein [Herbidospora sakaeratensis]
MISDDELLATADALQAEGREVLESLRLDRAFAGFGPAEAVGSVVSGLMVWRDLDVVLTAPHATTAGVLTALAALPGLIAVDYRDERGDRRPTPSPVDERHYAVCRHQGPGGVWKVDLTVWLHTVDRPTRAEAERLAREVTPEQRLAILRLKHLWHTRPEYPNVVGGTDVYDAVMASGVRTAEEFERYLAARQRR